MLVVNALLCHQDIWSHIARASCCYWQTSQWISFLHIGPHWKQQYLGLVSLHFPALFAKGGHICKSPIGGFQGQDSRGWGCCWSTRARGHSVCPAESQARLHKIARCLWHSTETIKLGGSAHQSLHWAYSITGASRPIKTAEAAKFASWGLWIRRGDCGWHSAYI